ESSLVDNLRARRLAASRILYAATPQGEPMASRNQQSVLCDICHQRPATVQVRVREDGRETTLNVCEQDYERLRAQEQRPLWGRDLFGGCLFGGLGDFFSAPFSAPSV